MSFAEYSMHFIVRVLVLVTTLILIGCAGHWTPNTEGLTKVPILGLAVQPDRPDRIVILTNRGINFSRDDGKTWGQGSGIDLSQRV